MNKIISIILVPILLCLFFSLVLQFYLTPQLFFTLSTLLISSIIVHVLLISAFPFNFEFTLLSI